jgi:hypothetical protein
MSTDDASAVVLIHPDDDINTIITKVRDSGSPHVQLLVPDGITELQSAKNCELLHRTLDADHVALIIITSDEKTLQIASQCHLDTIAVQGTSIVIPQASSSKVAPIPHSHLPKVQPSAPVAQDVPEGYDDFAAELDSLGDVMAGGSVPEGYDDFAAELDSLGDVMGHSQTVQGSRAAQSSDEFDPFAELDDLGATMSESKKPAAAPSPTPSAAQPRPRIRPEDIVLSDDEKDRASSVRPGGGRRDPGDKPKHPKKSHSPSPKDLQKQANAASTAKTSASQSPIPFSYILAVLIVPMVFVVVAIIWFGRTTVLVAPPVLMSGEIAFTDQPIPVIQPGAEGSTTAVQAQRVESVISSTEGGTVHSAIQAPATSTQGTVVLLNNGLQTINLPQGTEFIATNLQGQEVRFTSDSEIVIPPATTVQQARQIITTLGEVSVNITARSAGSNSNIEAGAITHIAIPGQEPFSVQAGSIIIEHGPLGGGSEQTVHIVKEDDVRPVLELALTSLNNQARQQLRTLAEQNSMSLEPTTIWPSPAYLTSGQGYDVVVEPAVGQPASDPNNPGFSVTVRANFNALATPLNQTLQQQFDQILPVYLQQAGVFTTGTGLRVSVNDWRWDGSRLVANGVVQPVIGNGELDANARAIVINAIRGKSRKQAEAELKNLISQGIISAYQLPDKTTALPSWTFLLTLKVVAAGS